MANTLPLRKRLFDITLVLVASPLWVPVLIMAAIGVYVSCGWPVLYMSKRYVKKGSYRTIVKFRAMVKNAESIANRDTVSPEPNKLLNITIQDNLYTTFGKLLEKTHLTELPQLLQVLLGTLTLVGNRPMPENMLKVARVAYPYLDERFSIPSGITGPAQLVGRNNLSDTDRLKIEITYAQICHIAYSPILDLKLLTMTIMNPLGLCQNISAEKMINEIMMSYLDQEQTETVTNAVKQIVSAPN